MSASGGPDEQTTPTARVALVVGGNRGIGRASALALERSGFTVAVTHRDQPAEGHFSVRCDVTDDTLVKRAFREIESALGPVAVLVANAGTTDFAPLIQTSDDDVSRLMSTNFEGTLRTCRRAARSMVRHRWGRVIIVSSTAAFLGVSWGALYAASKAATVGLARSLARELGPFGITVNAVLPGLIETDMTRGRERWSDEVRRAPLAKPGQPEDVAALVAFLASDEASYITGALIPVDGGLSMGLG